MRDHVEQDFIAIGNQQRPTHLFKRLARRHQVAGLNPDRLGYLNQVGLMIFEKTNHGREQIRIAGPLAQVGRPDAGQCQQPLRPARVGQRRGERAKCNHLRVAVVWR